MRVCFVALLGIALTGCSARHLEADLFNMVPSPRTPKRVEMSSVVPIPQSPLGGEASNVAPTPQTAQEGDASSVTPSPRAPQEAEPSHMAQALQTPQEAEPSNVARALQTPQGVELSSVARIPHPRREAETSNVAAGPQTPPAADVRNGAPAPQTPSDAIPLSLPSNPYGYGERNQDYVTLKGYSPGTVVVKTSQRRLFYVLDGDGRALRYPVGVGKAGRTWTGASFINSKRLRPPWSPPQIIKRDKPSIPDVIPGGSPSNPMGDAALMIDGGEYAIHGTNAPDSIGRFVSYGCIRMHNADIMDLYRRVRVGTQVVVER